jgi:hypothetical protein
MRIRKRLSFCAFGFVVCVATFAQSVNDPFSHFAGPSSGPGSAGGTGSAAQFAEPNGVAGDRSSR